MAARAAHWAATLKQAGIDAEAFLQKIVTKTALADIKSVAFWVTFLNPAAGRSLARRDSVNALAIADVDVIELQHCAEQWGSQPDSQGKPLCAG